MSIGAPNEIVTGVVVPPSGMSLFRLPGESVKSYRALTHSFYCLSKSALIAANMACWLGELSFA
jgi:hypothetical protein